MEAPSDRIDRRPILLAATALALLAAYPPMHWLVAASSVARLVIVFLWLSALYGSYSGATITQLTDVMPASVLAAAFGLAYSLATAIGGFLPSVVTWFGERTRDAAIVGALLAGAAALRPAATLILGRRGPATRRPWRRTEGCAGAAG